MSTRKLIIAALVTGMVILLAGAVQFIQIVNARDSGSRPVTTVAPRSPATTAAPAP